MKDLTIVSVNNSKVKIKNIFFVIIFLLTASCFLLSQDSWDYPKNGETVFTNSFFKLDPNEVNTRRDSWNKIFWFESITDLNQTANFYKTIQQDGDCASSGRIIFSLESRSPCYTKHDLVDISDASKFNYGQVKYRRGGPLCLSFNQGYENSVEFIVKVPFFLPPVPQLGEYYTCPDGSVEITVNLSPDVVFSELPTQVVWSKVDILTGNKTKIFVDDINSSLTSTLKTNIGTNPLDVETFEVFASKNYDGCIVEGEPVLIPVTSSIGAPLNPPIPQIISNCEAQSVTVTIPNEYGYDGVFWYKNPIDPNGPLGSIHDGFTYTYTPNEGLDQLYIEYYKLLESGCYIRSNRVPIAFISKPNLSATGLRTNNRIFDYRDFNETDCQVDRDPVEKTTTPFYYDLPNPRGLNITDSLINDFTSILSYDCNEFTLETTEPKWVVIRASDPLITVDYKETTNALGQKVYRVCADNISQNRGEYGYKDFQLQIRVRGKFTICGGNPENSATLDCDLPISGAIVRVITREPGTFTDNCAFPSDDIFKMMVDVSSECERQQFKTVCQDNQLVTLGPTEAELAAFFTSQGILGYNSGELSYSWSPAQGLSNSSVANPTISYQSAPNLIGEILTYTLTVTYNGALPPLFGSRPTYTFCSYVYKCSKCGNGSGVFEELGSN